MENEMITLVMTGAEIRPVITLPTSSTIYQLKKKIKKLTRVRVRRQRLLYNNVLLQDSFVIRDCFPGAAIEEVFMSVDLCPEERLICIKITNLNFSTCLTVNKVHKVSELKVRAGRAYGIDPRDITLWHMGKKMRDEERMYKYFLYDGSEVRLSRTGFNC